MDWIWSERPPFIMELGQSTSIEDRMSGLFATEPLLLRRVGNARILHLFPCLLAPAHSRFRVGIPWIRHRIVVMRRRFESRALRYGQRLGVDVIRLPVEIV